MRFSEMLTAHVGRDKAAELTLQPDGAEPGYTSQLFPRNHILTTPRGTQRYRTKRLLIPARASVGQPEIS